MPHHHDYDFEPSEVQPGSDRFSIFGRFSGSLPPWIWNSLMGITPQNRRAFQLQQRYLTPLTFEYVILTLFLRIGIFSLFCTIFWVIWMWYGRFNPFIFFLVLTAIASVYLGYQWSVLKNTTTVREEVLFNTLTNVVAWFFACVIVFDWASLIKSFMVQIGV